MKKKPNTRNYGLYNSMYTKFENIQNESIVIGKNSDYLPEVVTGGRRKEPPGRWNRSVSCYG